MTPSDPLFASQWHFSLIGDIETIWDEFTGDGVNVGVYDSGVDYNHEDLAGNYDSSLHVVDNFGNPVDPFPIAGGAHGTACAGLIGAVEGNGVGGVGVAFGTTITGVDIFDSSKYGYVNSDTAAGQAAFIDVIEQAAQFDVMSNSWGITPGYGSYQTVNAPGQTQDLVAAYELISQTARGGLGTSILQAAGNDNRNSNGDGANSSRFTITVAATEQDGTAADYTNHGSGILVAAPAAAVTTDITGAPGYSAGNYTTGFNGTSAATPVTAGVVSLMLEANEGLGWRDIQNVLAHSASLTGSAFGGAGTGFEDGSWYSTGAATFNGGGHTFHDNYGFGMVDAYAAVRMAEVWTTMTGGAGVSAGSTAVGGLQEQHAAHDSGGINMAFGDGSVGIGVAATNTQTVAQNVRIENIQLTLDMTFNYNGSVLEIYLIAPDGTRYEVLANESYYAGGALEWTWEITGARDTNSAGDWTIEIVDTDGFADVGTLNDWQLDFYGAAASADDIHTFTDDYMTLRAVEGARDAINDTNGGEDWLNFAAIRDDTVIDLLGNVLTVGGVAWGTLSGGNFENVVTGDGNDVITGNFSNNELHGMRGHDSIFGGGGTDTIYGGDGNDYIEAGTTFDDTIYGGHGHDVIEANGGGLVEGNNGNDVFIVRDGNTLANGGDTFNGGNGIDRFQASNSLAVGFNIDLLGETVTRNGNVAVTLINFENATGSQVGDTIIGNNDSNVLRGIAGNDTIRGEDGNDTLEGGSGNDTLLGGNGRDTMIGGDGEDEIRGADGNDRLIGNAGNDDLGGGSGNDILKGGDGDDKLEGGDGDDELKGGDGADLLRGGDGSDEIKGLDGDDVLEGADGADQMFGSNGNDVIKAGGGHDLLRGGRDNDTLEGGKGNDVLRGDGGNDTLEGGAGADTFRFSDGDDLVRDFTDDVDLVQIEIAAAGGQTIQQIIDGATLSGGDTTLTLATGTLTLKNLLDAQLLDDDMVFV